MARGVTDPASTAVVRVGASSVCDAVCAALWADTVADRASNSGGGERKGHGLGLASTPLRAYRLRRDRNRGRFCASTVAHEARDESADLGVDHCAADNGIPLQLLGHLAGSATAGNLLYVLEQTESWANFELKST